MIRVSVAPAAFTLAVALSTPVAAHAADDTLVPTGNPAVQRYGDCMIAKARAYRAAGNGVADTINFADIDCSNPLFATVGHGISVDEYFATQRAIRQGLMRVMVGF